MSKNSSVGASGRWMGAVMRGFALGSVKQPRPRLELLKGTNTYPGEDRLVSLNEGIDIRLGHRLYRGDLGGQHISLGSTQFGDERQITCLLDLLFADRAPVAQLTVGDHRRTRLSVV